MYTQDEILALQQREKELSEELRKIRKILNTRRSYERTYGEVKPYRRRKTPEELREYNRIKQREWRAKHKKEKLNESK